MEVPRSVRVWIIILAVLAVGLAAGFFARKSFFTASVRLTKERPAAVSRVEAAGAGVWLIAKDAVAPTNPDKKAFVMRLERLRARRIEVHSTGFSGGKAIVASNGLAAGDLVLAAPGSFEDGEAVAVRSGIDEKEILALTLDAGIAAAREKNLAESARFISPRYADSLGFDFRLMTGLLARAYKEFDRPEIVIVDPPDVRIEGEQAVIRESIKVRADYRGGRNYLLGGPAAANALLIRMEKSENGWKLVEIRGLMPLGLEEKYMKLLGAEVGLTLSGREKVEKREFCMPCRREMADRFGGEK
ncbi:MAG: hypothetical protein WAW37_00255 [Syntrophobacteraceae bacterium]